MNSLHPLSIRGTAVNRMICCGAAGFACLLVALSSVPGQTPPDQLTVHERFRVQQGSDFVVREKVETWEPKQTAIIVCDMWDAHHCLNAVRRVEEMAPRMNQVLETARQRGVLIIHAPSSCMEPYKDHPGRKLAQSAPKAANLPKDI